MQACFRLGHTWLALIGLALLAACQGGAGEPTATRAPPPTPPPTATETSAPTSTSTATSTATPDLTATAAIEATQAMAAVIQGIDRELREIGYNTDTGSLAWANDRPLPITIDAYNTYDLIPVGSGLTFTDFVLKADVTWESTSGYIICGFWFRAQGYEEDSEYYAFQTIRLSGWPSWDVEYWQYNRWKATISPGGKIIDTPHINQEQGSTNSYILASEGNVMTAYANGHRLGMTTVNSLREGQIALYGWQDTGRTTCSFDNAWLWDLTGSVSYSGPVGESGFAVPTARAASTGQAAATTRPASTAVGTLPIGWFDGPRTKKDEYSGEISLVGWAAAEAGIARVEIYIDNGLYVYADFGIQTNDLGQQYPDLPDSPNFGFVYALNTRLLNNGNHSIYARAVDKNGNSVILDPGKTVIKVNN